MACSAASRVIASTSCGSVSGGWDDALCRRLCECAHEVVEPGGFGDDQEAGGVGADGVGVGDVARSVDERSGGRVDDVAADPEGQLTLDDVEPLVFAAMDVQR